MNELRCQALDKFGCTPKKKEITKCTDKDKNCYDIVALTFNMGGVKLKKNTWIDILIKCNIYNSFFKTKHIVFISLQEADSDLVDAFKEITKNNFKLYTKSTNIPNYRIFGLLFVNRFVDESVKPSINNQINCYGIICTKGSIFMQLKLQQYTLLFIASHLPIDTNLKDYGIQMRNEAMEQIKKYCDKINPHLVILAGDLNYRRIGGKDQLSNTFLDTFGFKESEIEFSPTCKLCNVDEKECTTGYNKKREPSHCDRILYRTTKQLTVNDYFSFSDINFVGKSDHNAVYLDFNLKLN